MNSQELDLLVADWDDVYKKGQTTFWVLLALYDGKKYTAQIDEFIRTATHDHFQVREQSLYRALRRFHDMQLVGIEKIPAPGGPDRKYYHLTPIGKAVLARFTHLNLVPLFQNSTHSLITNLIQEHSPHETIT